VRAIGLSLISRHYPEKVDGRPIQAARDTPAKVKRPIVSRLLHVDVARSDALAARVDRNHAHIRREPC
jgi:hypothetical protein